MDTRTGDEFPDPDASDDSSPASVFPGAGERVDAAERQAALDSMLMEDAEQGDDAAHTPPVDSRAPDGD